MPAVIPHTPVGIQLAEQEASDFRPGEARTSFFNPNEANYQQGQLSIDRQREQQQERYQSSELGEHQEEIAQTGSLGRQRLAQEARQQANDLSLRSLEIQQNAALRGQTLSAEQAYRQATLENQNERIQNLLDHNKTLEDQRQQGLNMRGQSVLQRAQQIQQEEADKGRQLSDEEAWHQAQGEKQSAAAIQGGQLKQWQSLLSTNNQNIIASTTRIAQIEGKASPLDPATGKPMPRDQQTQALLDQLKTNLSDMQDYRGKLENWSASSGEPIPVPHGGLPGSQRQFGGAMNATNTPPPSGSSFSAGPPQPGAAQSSSPPIPAQMPRTINDIGGTQTPPPQPAPPQAVPSAVQQPIRPMPAPIGSPQAAQGWQATAQRFAAPPASPLPNIAAPLQTGPISGQPQNPQIPVNAVQPPQPASRGRLTRSGLQQILQGAGTDKMTALKALANQGYDLSGLAPEPGQQPDQSAATGGQ